MVVGGLDYVFRFVSPSIVAVFWLSQTVELYPDSDASEMQIPNLS